MKLLITGDFHISPTNRLEVTKVLTSISNLLVDTDGIIILGDVFDTPNPLPEEVQLFIDFILSIPISKSIYIISGNHEEEKKYEGFQWITSLRSNVVYGRTTLIATIAGKSVLMSHTNVAESKMGPDDRTLSSISYKEMNKGKNYDAILLGHIHKSQIISPEKPLVLHPGSPYYINFGERNDTKCIYFIDFPTLKVTKYIDLPFLKMNQLEFNDTSLPKADKELDRQLNNDRFMKLKVVFDLYNSNLEVLKQVHDLIKKYKNSFAFFKYELKVHPKKISVKGSTKQKSMQQLFNDFCKASVVDKQIKTLISGLLK